MLKQAQPISLLLAIAPLAEMFAGEPVQNNQVNLKVARFDNRVEVECRPANADTSTRQEWKSICNNMAAPQVQELVAKGVIEAQQGPVYDSAAIAASVATLTRVVPLSPVKH